MPPAASNSETAPNLKTCVTMNEAAEVLSSSTQDQPERIRRRKSGPNLGWSKYPEYQIWGAIIQRCTNPKQETFERYGKRGVRVHPRWMGSFEAFISDMGRRPSARHQIDRFPNRDGDYEPGNCRWATPSENSRNRSSNVFWEHEGKMIHQTDMAQIVAKQRGITLKSADAHLRRRRLRKLL